MSTTANRRQQSQLATKLAKAMRELEHAESQAAEWERDAGTLRTRALKLKEDLAACLRVEKCTARVWHVPYGQVVAMEIPREVTGFACGDQLPMVLRYIPEAP